MLRSLPFCAHRGIDMTIRIPVVAFGGRPLSVDRR
jgi:hypothetical protein